MDLPATSLEVMFLDLNGEAIDRPREWTEALVEVAAEPQKWESMRLTVNQSDRALTLRRVGSRVRVIAEWPRSNAGSYVIRAELNETSVTRSVTIMPGKLSAESFATLLSDLESRLPAAVAIGLQQAGGLAGLTVLPPEETTVAQELARLRRAVLGSSSRPGLVKVLPDIGCDPYRILEVDELWVRTDLARRPHPARLREAIRSPANMVGSEQPLRVIDQRVHYSVDIYENRLVRLFHEQVVHRLLRLQRHVVRTGSAAQFDAVLGLLRALATARREASFLDEASSTNNPPTTVTMVLLKRPAYRAAFEGYLELHRSIAIRLDEPRLDLPLENLPDLYQLWGTLSAYAILLEVAAARGYCVDHQRLVHRDRDGAFVRMVPPGQTALRLVHGAHGTVITFVPERSYGRTGLIRSISFQQVPDITIQVDRPGKAPMLLLLDPKYKLDSETGKAPEANGRPKKVDIDKMHAYRDAIRNAEGERVVVAACTLYPGPTVRYAPGIEAIQSDPLHVEAMMHRIGELLGNLI